MNEYFENKTNKELISYCKRNNIDIDSKNVSKPTKSELLSAIEKAGKFEEETNLETEGVDEYEDPEFISDEDLDEFLSAPEPTMPTRTPQQSKQARDKKRREQSKLLQPLRRVVITENDKNQTTISTQVHYCTWGNRLIGHFTDRFVCGSPWHVRVGALQNLQGMTAARSIQDEEGNTIRHETVPKYIIQELPQLSEEERAVIAKRQLIRDSSIESLI